jgi:hypothetical protein
MYSATTQRQGTSITSTFGRTGTAGESGGDRVSRQAPDSSCGIGQPGEMGIAIGHRALHNVGARLFAGSAWRAAPRRRALVVRGERQERLSLAGPTRKTVLKVDSRHADSSTHG